ncbi:MAG: carbamoyltransferase HypF [Ectothiorhodospiraceae bacterium]|nr:carbamoyltransferase HypF [Ectothiorhodospiraceae bacterium]
MSPPPPSAETVTLRIRGLVQGVGFRPTVWRLARRLGIGGEVRNDGHGVLIHAVGTAGDLVAFERAIRDEAPPLARIDAIEREASATSEASTHFRIAPSTAGGASTGVAPDAATCPECLREVLDPHDRRHRYPFANCTHCGPRLSIVRAIPYDRASTSMAAFEMCPQCRAEYADPADRRFHAQPIACPVCGPRAWLEDDTGAVLDADTAIESAARLIGDGAVVAVKGVGGFHLACDATDAEAVARLRAAKHRDHKPFALMATDIDMVRAHARVGRAESALLTSTAAPIVVLDRVTGPTTLAAGIAPGQDTLGFMLPYTPLHHLLLRAVGRPIVLTSGNRSDEPQCIDDAEARARLAGIATAFLMHDREIVERLDDSVARVAAGRPRVLRRGRGMAPGAFGLPRGLADAAPVLAMGGELKNAFCLARAGAAVLAQHCGDLEDALTHRAWRDTIARYRQLYRFEPARIAVDRHADYLSTQWGRRLATDSGAALIEVQHHHAHAAAVMAEHGRPCDASPVLAITLDGLGLGDDGTLWGAEVLLCDYRASRRVASFEPVPLPGGNRAMREPWRNAVAHLWRSFGLDATRRRWPGLALLRRLPARDVEMIERMSERGVNAPPASSAGRLFDAVAAVLDIHPMSVGYEGQAAVRLETLAARARDEVGSYPSRLVPGEPARIDWTPMWEALLDDLTRGVARERIAARFHRGLAQALVDVVAAAAVEHAVDTVVLGGGVMQNRVLLEALVAGLTTHGLEVLAPRLAPANDGGLALGQAAIAAAAG